MSVGRKIGIWFQALRLSVSVSVCTGNFIKEANTRVIVSCLEFFFLRQINTKSFNICSMKYKDIWMDILCVLVKIVKNKSDEVELKSETRTVIVDV